MLTPDRRWMEPLLEILYEDYSATAAVRLLRDEAAREAIVPLLASTLELRGHQSDGLTASAGDGLLQGLLALRTKFPLEEAREKVRLNIAMTSGER